MEKTAGQMQKERTKELEDKANVLLKKCKEQYFIDNSDFINMLDFGNVLKQSQRTHLCIE